MPNISELKQSKFLTKHDVGNGILVTIAGCEQQNVSSPGAPEEQKWCLTFREVEKPLVLNSTNGQIAAQICGSEEIEEWVGKKIVLYTDPTIAYAGRIIGGIRVRAPKTGTAQGKAPAARPAPRPAPVPEPVDPGPEDGDESVPF